MAPSERLDCRESLTVGVCEYVYYSLEAAEAAGLGQISRLPVSLKILLENLLRHVDGRSVTLADVEALAGWGAARTGGHEIAYFPARVMMPDASGVPLVVDLASMRGAVARLGGDPASVNPLKPVDLIIDHSLNVDFASTADAFQRNVEVEYDRNGERYAFLKWGQQAFRNLRVVPPGTGICHQINLEYLAQTVWVSEDSDGRVLAYPDTLVGMDSHTTMVNALSVLGWGVGGIEAGAAMLGRPISMLVPDVVGVCLTGEPKEGTTATDLVLNVTEMFRAHGVVGKFVEFFGPGLDALALADRATIANMAPEYGATCGLFPIDAETLSYLAFTGRDPARVALVEAYARAQGMWRDAEAPDPVFTETLELNLATVEPSLAGPKRPQDRVALGQGAASFKAALPEIAGGREAPRRVAVPGRGFEIGDGDVAIAAITSCTNTSNPVALIAAGLVARSARARGLRPKPWVKTSFTPGSRVVGDYMARAGLQDDLDALGFDLVGYGCATCMGNSGPLDAAIAGAIDAEGLVVTSVTSSNRNFEGRIHPQVRASYIASPPLVVAYALAGTIETDLTGDPIAKGTDGAPVYLRDIWPSSGEVQAVLEASLSPEMFRTGYGSVFDGDAHWQGLGGAAGGTFAWEAASTYIKEPPFLSKATREPAPLADIAGARPLVLLGDSITTDHISPGGAIAANAPAGQWLIANGVAEPDFNSYVARRSNHEVMIRGTFANVRIRNEMAPGTEGGFTRHEPSGEVVTIFDAAMAYAEAGVPLVVVAGKEYGTGSSRDWAAKGTRLLGIRAVIAESFERIHRANLVFMGLLPLEFTDGRTRKILGLDGSEVFDIAGIAAGIAPGMELACTIARADGATETIPLLARIDTADEAEYFRHGGIMQYVLREMLEG